MKTIIVTCLIALFSCGAFAGISQTEKSALLDLYHSTNGASWTNTWNLADSVDSWYGVTIEDNKVVGLSLLFNNLNGSLPVSIGNLVNLKFLELSFNSISGTLPTSLGKLENLEVLAFNGNKLSGSIPVSLANLYMLKQLHLSSNHLSGEIPEVIGDLGQLEVFNVFDNDLVGNLPIGLAMNTNLRELIVAENQLNFSSKFSTILLSNSGSKVDLFESNSIIPTTTDIIAIESSEDEN